MEVRVAKEQIDLKTIIMKTLRTMNKMKKKEKQESGPRQCAESRNRALGKLKEIICKAEKWD